MPRQARIDIPGALHHIICRGIERGTIFRDDHDKDDFVHRLVEITSKSTARSIGDLTPDQVTVSEVDRGMTNVDWKAITPKGNYRCSADDMLRRVNCVKK